MRIVLDTNILLVSYSDRSTSHWIVQALKNQKFEMSYTTELLTEYEEQFSKHWSPFMAEVVVTSILELPNTIPVTVYYQLNLIQIDVDDNKFADCAFASNADYLVTDDKHFDVLKTVDFPKIQVVSLEQFRQILLDRNLITP